MAEGSGRGRVAALSPGAAVNTDALRFWVDEAEPAGLDWPRPELIAATAISVALRAVSVVLMPVSVVLALALMVFDLRRRRGLSRLTVLWLVLLCAMATRVGLLAVLNATSLPAMAPLYLSPAVGVALLFTAGALGDFASRLVTARRSGRQRNPVRGPAQPLFPPGPRHPAKRPARTG